MWKLVLAAALLFSEPAWGQSTRETVERAWESGTAPTIVEGAPVVLEGDTLLFEDLAIRLWGVDAPEISDWPLGAYSQMALDLMIAGRNPIRCEVVAAEIVAHQDKLFIGVCRDNNVENIAAKMIQEGWAIPNRVSTANDDLHRTTLGLGTIFDIAVARAHRNRVGIWANPIIPPSAQ